MAKTTEKLSTLLDTHSHSKMEEQRTRNLNVLQRQFPGVCGRLSDVVKPTDSKYNVAVSTVRRRRRRRRRRSHEWARRAGGDTTR
jgi:chromosome segregation ATPase